MNEPATAWSVDRHADHSAETIIMFLIVPLKLKYLIRSVFKDLIF